MRLDQTGMATFDRQELEASHRPDAIQRRLAEGPPESYLRDAVYGSIDGAVTTFAVVSGVAGADLSVGVLLVLGVANLVADGFSMAASNYLGTRAESEQHARAWRTEQLHVLHHPEGEIEEVRQIFAAKGFEADDLERVVAVITSNHDRWIETMLREEHGLPGKPRDAARAALATFFSFGAAGAVPLMPFVLGLAIVVHRPFVWSGLLTGATFFAVGAAKARFVDQPWWRGGAETLAVGGAAAILAWAAGALLSGGF